MLNRPIFTFEGSSPDKLYTYIIADLDGSAFSANDIQYMVSNVPGNRLNSGNYDEQSIHLLHFHEIIRVITISTGDVRFQYAAPFTFTRTADDQIDVTSTDMSTFAALVYEQTNGPIAVPIETDFCGPQIFDRLLVRIK